MRLKGQFNKLRRQLEKLHSLQTAKYEVEMYEQQIASMQSIHKNHVAAIDWHSIEATTAPYIKGDAGPNELAAKEALISYKPSIWDKIFNKVERKKEQLTNKMIEGKLADEQAYKAWEDKIGLAKRVNSYDYQAYEQVIDDVNPFENISAYGSRFQYDVQDSQTIIVQFNVNSAQIVPTSEKTLTKTGKLSIKELSKTKIHRMYQDYVCSCIMRIARDLFAIVPAQQVIVHAQDERLNSSTGHMEQQTILSVRITRNELNRLNFDRIDCSEAMSNFEHNMKFVGTSGFHTVTPIASIVTSG